MEHFGKCEPSTLHLPTRVKKLALTMLGTKPAARYLARYRLDPLAHEGRFSAASCPEDSSLVILMM